MRTRKGFTLIEMLVVIAIIAVLVSITIPAVSGAVLKANAAANAANLRAVQSAVQNDFMAHPEKYGNARITKAKNEVLLFGEETAFNAPAARAIDAGSVKIPAGTQMMVRIQEDSSVVATYAGFDLGALGGLIGGGDISNILPSLPDDMLGDMEEDDIFDILEGVINGSQEQQSPGVQPYDPPLYVDVEQLKSFMATAITAGQEGSDCVTCRNQNKCCPSYYVTPNSNGKAYMCDVCGHPPGVHFTPVYMDVAEKVIGVVQCQQTGTPHAWDENHVCSVCKAEYPIKQHIYQDPMYCKVCNRYNQEEDCKNGKHVFNREGVCGTCGALPVTTGPCACETFAMAGMYCANCGHSAMDHVYEDYSFGTCKFGH